MPEESNVILVIIFTIIVVTMTSIFACCWRKKGAGNAAEGKTSKKKLSSVKEGSGSPVAERSENGQVAADTKSTPSVMITDDDLGDFSDVQRETEILRSYRKPPPPKNRARQSRAPRAVMTTKSGDIFSELSEDNKEDIEDKDEAEALLRSKSPDKEGCQRDARSSMLADIEQTLAALHMTELVSAASDDASLAKDTASLSESATKADNTKEDKVNITKNAEEKDDNRLETSSLHGSKHSLAETETSSGRASPMTKPKPKVNPKPGLRMGATQNASKQNTPEEATSTGELIYDEAAQPTPSSDAKEEEKSSPDQSSDTAPSLPPATAQEADSTTTDQPQDAATAECLDTPDVSTNVDTDVLIKPNVDNEDLAHSPAAPEGETGTSEQETTAQEDISPVIQGTEENSAAETLTASDNKDTEHSPPQPEAEPQNPVEMRHTAVARLEVELEKDPQKEDANVSETALVSQYKRVSQSKFITVNGEPRPAPKPEKTLASTEMASSPPQENTSKLKDMFGNKRISPQRDEATKRISPPKDEATKRISPQRDEAVKRISPDKNGAQKKEEVPAPQLQRSQSDEQGKGKFSKIPVRAGSKPRSSPPKSVGDEKTTDGK